MDVVFAEAPGFLRAEVRDDEFEQPRHIRPLHAREQPAPLLIIERHLVLHQRLQRLDGEAPHPAVIRERVLLEDIAPHARRVERGRQVRLFVAHLLLVIELQAQPLAEKRQRLLRVRIIAQQRLAVLDDLPAV